MENKLGGHSIDLIRRSLIELGCDCAAPTLASRLRRTAPNLFRSGNWSGFDSFKAMMLSADRFFEFYYPDCSATDARVRLRKDTGIDRNADSRPYLNREITPKEIAETLFTEEFCRSIVREYNIPVDLQKPRRMKFYYTYLLYRLEAEGKLWTDGKCAVCNVGLFKGNGMYPVYLVARRRPGGNLAVGLHCRNDRDGRYIVRVLGNKEPQPACFPVEHFDDSLEIVPECGHILQDNSQRLPESLPNMIRNNTDLHTTELNNHAIIQKYMGYLLVELN